MKENFQLKELVYNRNTKEDGTIKRTYVIFQDQSTT